jgi:hypothetical protein
VRVVGRRTEGGTSDDSELYALFAAIAARDHGEIGRLLELLPALATRTIRAGASRQSAETCFLAALHHYIYAGDTALHIAAAAYDRDLARMLLTRGAQVSAANRRGAQPLHYAADGGPDYDRWDPAGQSAVIALLIQAGADPNAADRSGVGPLHRAVRSRCAAAARTLIDNGADPRRANKNGSTPLHLAVQTTGKSNSGSQAAKAQQRELIAILLQAGAQTTDLDARGKSVQKAAPSAWVRGLLDST